MMCLSYRFAPIVLRQTLTPFVGEIVQAHFPLPLHLHNHFNLLVCEVLTERSEGKARSGTMIGLQNHCSLSFGEVPAEFAKQMKMKIENYYFLKY